MIEGILALALSVLPAQTARLYRWTGKTRNDRGLEVDTFAEPAAITGSIQPVDRSRYVYFGLDAQKGYISIYSTAYVRDLTRTTNPDQVEYMGRRYRVVNRSDWHAPSDYNGVLAVDIGEAKDGDA